MEGVFYSDSRNDLYGIELSITYRVDADETLKNCTREPGTYFLTN